MLFLPISLITQVRLFHLSISGDKKVEFEKQKKGIFRKLIRRFLVNWIYFHAIYESAFSVFGDKGSCDTQQKEPKYLPGTEWRCPKAEVPLYMKLFERIRNERN